MPSFIKALIIAQRDANAPLLEELQGIRAVLERLETIQTKQLAEPKTAVQQIDPKSVRETAETSKYGPVVRIALWFERTFRR